MSFLPPPHWLDGWSFGRALLKAGDDPWADPATLGHFSRDLKGLLRLPLIDVNLDTLVIGDDLSVSDLEDRLTGDNTAQAIKTGLSALSGAGAPVALSLPGPAALATLAGEASDEDAMDDLGLALADLARTIAGAGADALLLREAEDAAFDFLGPLCNVAGHNGLALGLMVTAGGDAPDGVAIAYGCTSDAVIVDDAVWSGGPLGETGPHCYARIPDDASPDAVQAALDRLGL